MHCNCNICWCLHDLQAQKVSCALFDVINYHSIAAKVSEKLFDLGNPYLIAAKLSGKLFDIGKPYLIAADSSVRFHSSSISVL